MIINVTCTTFILKRKNFKKKLQEILYPHLLYLDASHVRDKKDEQIIQ